MTDLNGKHVVVTGGSAGLGLAMAQFKRYGNPLNPEQIGKQVVDLLGDPRYAKGVAYGFRSGAEILPLDM